MMTLQKSGIIIVDYGSQYSLLIARKLREIGVYSEITDSTLDFPPKSFEINGIILSGGPDSANDLGARTIPQWVLKTNKPILGICYGMQLLVKYFGGSLRSGQIREYGKAELTLNPEMNEKASSVFYNLEVLQTVWMSHGDDIEHLPKDFSVAGKTTSGVIAAIVHKSLPIIGLQFHPEVHHTINGIQILKQFATDLCKIPLTWHPETITDAAIKNIKDNVGTDGHVLMAVSGGVDSTVALSLIIKALGPDKVTAIFVDHGFLRKDEARKVNENFKSIGINHLNILNESELFFSRLKGVSDPEKKRKIMGQTFIEVFENFAKKTDKYTHLGQGTLYPDVVESASSGSGTKVIKSHHNVGGLPEKLQLKLIEPFRYLFKDEVRKIGRTLGLPKNILGRHPFPGPGLAIRILGEVSREKVHILQKADDIFIEALKKNDLYDKVWQAFAVLLPVKTVGIMGDNRTYQYCAALRSVNAIDGMTASVSEELNISFLREVADDIVRKTDGINRVVYDISGKPPSTIEWE